MAILPAEKSVFAQLTYVSILQKFDHREDIYTS